MATTTNYAWSTPDNSGLVKNGAQDIRTLGDAIDTAVWNVGYGQAGKNKIINGDFNIWQRGTSFAGLTTNVYTADRFRFVPSGATATVTRETFTPGTAPVAGYESSYFLRCDATVANDNWGMEQPVEDVRVAAGQTITISCWLKSSTSINVYAQIAQVFGSGGSSTVFANTANQATTTGWVRYSFTIAVPSISGKTIGTNSNLLIRIVCATNTAATLDFWGFQAEYGSFATPFQTASGSIAGELALAQRYYYRNTIPVASSPFGAGFGNTTTEAQIFVSFPVQMRTNPTALEQSGTAANYQIRRQGGATVACSAVPTWAASTLIGAQVAFPVASGLTAGEGLIARSAAVTTAYLGWSAEL
jgi:hypothetical protein